MKRTAVGLLFVGIALRNALNATVFPNPVYARPGLAVGDVVRAQDIQELRNYAR
jgi:hypothetical protein